jgi:hypothetical protein
MPTARRTGYKTPGPGFPGRKQGTVAFARLTATTCDTDRLPVSQ